MIPPVKQAVISTVQENLDNQPFVTITRKLHPKRIDKDATVNELIEKYYNDEGKDFM